MADLSRLEGVTAVLRDDHSEMRIRVRGPFNLAASRAMRAEYEGQERAKTYVVDLSQSQALTASALGSLLILKKWAEPDAVKIVGMSANFDYLIKTAGFAEEFNGSSA